MAEVEGNGHGVEAEPEDEHRLGCQAALLTQVRVESSCQLPLPTLSWDIEERSRDFCSPICSTQRMYALPPRVASDLAPETSQVAQP